MCREKFLFFLSPMLLLVACVDFSNEQDIKRPDTRFRLPVGSCDDSELANLKGRVLFERDLWQGGDDTKSLSSNPLISGIASSESKGCSAGTCHGTPQFQIWSVETSAPLFYNKYVNKNILPNSQYLIKSNDLEASQMLISILRTNNTEPRQGGDPWFLSEVNYLKAWICDGAPLN